jgi:CheY-like chemotaxis protein
MPGKSGHEDARRMRREAWGRKAILIAHTGWGQDTDKQAALAAGFDDHLTKPVDPDDVEAVLTQLLGDAAGAADDSDVGGSASRA